MKYWHELTQKEVEILIESKVTYRYLLDNYKQPDWCNYPNALEGALGCWSLMDATPNGLRTKISLEFCKNCELFIEREEKSPEKISNISSSVHVADEGKDLQTGE